MEYKFKINNTEHGERIQDVFFARGFVWHGDDSSEYLNKPFNYLFVDHKISFGTSPSFFEMHKAIEAKVLMGDQYKMLVKILRVPKKFNLTSDMIETLMKIENSYFYTLNDIPLLNNLRKLYLQNEVR